MRDRHEKSSGSDGCSSARFIGGGWGPPGAARILDVLPGGLSTGVPTLIPIRVRSDFASAAVCVLIAMSARRVESK